MHELQIFNIMREIDGQENTIWDLAPALCSIIRPVHVHLKMDNVDYLEKPSWKKKLHIFAIPLWSRHMKNVIECWKYLFAYFNALETHSALGYINFSMTSLLTHNVAHSTRHSFRSKINNQPLKKFLSLAISWVKVIKNWKSF